MCNSHCNEDQFLNLSKCLQALLNASKSDLEQACNHVQENSKVQRAQYLQKVRNQIISALTDDVVEMIDEMSVAEELTPSKFIQLLIHDEYEADYASTDDEDEDPTPQRVNVKGMSVEDLVSQLQILRNQL